MAYRIANATGNFGTAATWLQGTNTPSLHASSNTTLSTSGVTSATFTAPNTSNQAVGLLVYLVAKGTATTITATLQESTVDTAHTATITLSDVEARTWLFFKPASGYTFTTTGAGAYRWKLAVDSGTTTTVAQASTANFAYISCDNRQTVPVSGDPTWVVGANGTTPAVVTVDGTRTCGNTGAPASRSITNALYIGDNATLALDETASCTLNHNGGIFVDVGGTLSCGTVTPLNKSYTAQIIALSSNQGIAGASGGSVILQGAAKSSTTLFKTTYVSGLGTAASPLVVADAVDWDVGDEIKIAPGTDSGTNYNETETKFIITKNSSTSYVLSDTSGGSEAAFTYTHNTDSIIGNFQRNIIIKGSTTSIFTGFNMVAPPATGYIDLDWVRFENISNQTFLGAVPTNVIYIYDKVEMDYCVAIYGSAGLFSLNNISTASTRRGLMTYNTATVAGTSIAYSNIVLNTASNVTLEDCVSFGGNGYGLGVTSSFSCTIKDCSIYASNNATTTYAGIALDQSGKNQFTNVTSSANRVNGLYYNSGSANVFTDCKFGLGATNGSNDISMGTGFSNALFEDSTFESTTLINNYLNMTAGSEIRFNRYQDTDNQHRWYDVYGHGISEETVIRSPGLSVKLVPENLATGFTWSFKVPVVQNSIAGFRGYFLKNATLGSGVVTIAMYLPGNSVGGGVPDASVTLDNTTGSAFTDADEQSVAMTSTYSGDIPGAAVITINIKSNTAGAALYADDFFNAGDRTTTFDSITGLNVWSDGKPLEVISPSVSSADDIAEAVKNAVWGDTDTYSAGTKGAQQKDASKAKLLL